jgi:hypothetical protein
MTRSGNLRNNLEKLLSYFNVFFAAAVQRWDEPRHGPITAKTTRASWWRAMMRVSSFKPGTVLRDRKLWLKPKRKKHYGQGDTIALSPSFDLMTYESQRSNRTRNYHGEEQVSGPCVHF